LILLQVTISCKDKDNVSIFFLGSFDHGVPYHVVGALGEKVGGPQAVNTNSCKCKHCDADTTVSYDGIRTRAYPASPCKISTGPLDASPAHLKQLVAITTTSSVLPAFYTAPARSSNAIVGRGWKRNKQRPVSPCGQLNHDHGTNFASSEWFASPLIDHVRGGRRQQ